MCSTTLSYVILMTSMVSEVFRQTSDAEGSAGGPIVTIAATLPLRGCTNVVCP